MSRKYKNPPIKEVLKDINELEVLYTFLQPKEIRSMLRANEDLISILFDAYKQITIIFRENIIDLCLEYNRDHEEDFDCLALLIKTCLNPDLSLDLLNKLDEEWWLDVDEAIRCSLIIMVRPV